MAPVKWGICGTGSISESFSESIKLLGLKKHQVVAVVSRELSKAQTFADKYSATAHASYEEFAKDPNIDIIYVGTINPTHYDLCKMFIDAGKNVLCEKPLTMNYRQSEELVGAARQKNVFFMEGLWSRFFPAYKKIREEIAAGVIGDVMKVSVDFVVKIDEVPRLREMKLGGGVLLDIGIYAIQLATMVFNEDPTDIQAMAELNDEGVDTVTSIQLKFSGGRHAQLYCDSRLPAEKKTATIHGTKGLIELRDNFFCPEEVITPSGTHSFPLPGKSVNYINDQGLIYEIQCVGECLAAASIKDIPEGTYIGGRAVVDKGATDMITWSTTWGTSFLDVHQAKKSSGKKECPEVPHEESLRFARIMDNVKQQIGVVYEQD